ncbi:MAG TPA: GtrA family protein [Acetobacteraceae bacterium]|nr:GtrA family protein [Acetobacteraceae bacterium]
MTEHEQFLRFLAAGGTSAVLNMGSRWLLGHVFSYELSVALAYVVGVASAFALMRMFVFEPAGDAAHAQFTRFVLVNILGFAVVWLVSVGLVRGLFPALGFRWHAETIGHAFGIASSALTSWRGHRLFSFRTTE